MRENDGGDKPNQVHCSMEMSRLNPLCNSYMLIKILKILGCLLTTLSIESQILWLKGKLMVTKPTFWQVRSLFYR
jgi:hypothetical protein